MAPLDGTKTPPTQNITTIGTIGGMNNNILHPNVEDKVATGTEAILHSPHISDGPGRIANAPVPSVYVRSGKVPLDVVLLVKSFHDTDSYSIYILLSSCLE
jgi:hypothetical protein